MTREEWQPIKSVSASALERPEAERLAYVASCCEGEEEFFL